MQKIPKPLKVSAVIIGIILLIEAGGALMKKTEGTPMSLVVSIVLVMVYVTIAYYLYQAWRGGKKQK